MKTPITVWRIQTCGTGLGPLCGLWTSALFQTHDYPDAVAKSGEADRVTNALRKRRWKCAWSVEETMRHFPYSSNCIEELKAEGFVVVKLEVYDYYACVDGQVVFDPASAVEVETFEVKQFFSHYYSPNFDRDENLHQFNASIWKTRGY